MPDVAPIIGNSSIIVVAKNCLFAKSTLVSGHYSKLLLCEITYESNK
ncbi:hypothetical protein KPSA3_04870 [Pseudomonas syringae pv. actinidiae]|uniref:Uncharacterized protein n=1 Tax=Pseudomonas syringae pv. actinidiae TaxID=103796 RepID=A0AAN4Q8B9_PSESF|nr:hypothetical protein KPSA3_04870 [Pseudomonas syringae pv. actinidiae]